MPAPDPSPNPETREAAADQAAGKKPGPKIPPEIRINVSWCKGCGLCVDYCNRGVLEMEGVLPHVVKAERCTRCMQCEAICPDFAIEVGDSAAGGGNAR